MNSIFSGLRQALKALFAGKPANASACPPGYCASRPACADHACPGHPIQLKAARRLHKP